ncbi:MAG: hypothetical protein ACOYO0_11760 [Sandarakinorhabdus sp.]|jgi:hypothetical protein
MVVIVLVLLSLAAAVFMMLTDTRKNDNFRALEKAAADPAEPPAAVTDPAKAD